MTFKSLPLTVRNLTATEATLERLYEAAKLGLRGNALALRADLMPVELARLKELDPLVEMAILKGYADAEAEMALTVRSAAMDGNVTAAMFYLKARENWKETVTTEITGAGGGPVSFEVVGIAANRAYQAAVGSPAEAASLTLDASAIQDSSWRPRIVEVVDDSQVVAIESGQPAVEDTVRP